MIETPKLDPEKNADSAKKAPSVLFLVVPIVVLLGIAAAFFFMRQPPAPAPPPAAPAGQQPAGDIPAGTLSAEIDPISLTVPPRAEGSIIVSSLEYDSDSSVARVLLFLPQGLDEADVLVNGEQVDVKIDRGVDIVAEIEIPAALRSNQIDITFLSGSEQLAVCTLTAGASTVPSGDCGW